MDWVNEVKNKNLDVIFLVSSTGIWLAYLIEIYYEIIITRQHQNVIKNLSSQKDVIQPSFSRK